MRTTVFVFVSLLATFASFSQTPLIVPQPVSVQVKKGFFTLDKNTVIAAANEPDKRSAAVFNDFLQTQYGFTLPVKGKATKNYIRLSTRTFVKAPDKDAYRLSVSPDGAIIEGDTYAGTFYGLQSLIQLLPLEKGNFLKVPCVAIQDAPRFGYRGLMLDACRHFFPVSFVKRYIDFIALHKMNYFHWHLTDDQGWRIEIKKYPELMTKSAYRNGTIIGRYPGTGNDETRYGGYYTQDEVKDVVQYAADRHITVVPEIEMPGHASAAISAYPWLSCFPGQPTKTTGAISTKSKEDGGKIVQETWGVFDDVFCAGKDSTFVFLQDVIDEILPLFPSKYIHVGGDESPKVHWKICPACQKRMKDEGLKDEHELQSYFIQRMERYINNRGRTIIGWDEILEGGLAPKAVVMSWRGETGGIEAAKQKHQVIMTPTTYAYFDYTQSQNEDSVTIGGYVPVEKVYNYEPIPKELTAQDAKYVLGAQANLWSEYLGNEPKVEYMIFPRLSALSEVLWTAKGQKSWPKFEQKIPVLFQRYDFWSINYSRAFYDLKAELLPAPGNKGVALKLSTKDKKGALSYGIAGKHFQKAYTAPVVINEEGAITAMYTAKNGLADTVSFDLKFNKATGKKITLKEAPSLNYPGDGAFTLVNGVQNTRGLSRGREFIGYNGGDLEAVIDLGNLQPVSNVIVHSIGQGGSWIYPPASLQVAFSTDGATYTEQGTTDAFEITAGGNGTLTVNSSGTARFVKVVLKNYGVIPEGKPGAGNRGWLFADEIEIH